MKPELDRRRCPEVPKPNGGERWYDIAAASERAGTPPAEPTWRWGAILWVLAALAGTAFGAGWLQRLL